MPIKSYVPIGWANKGSKEQSPKESTCSHMFQIHWEEAKKKKNTTIQSEIGKQNITFHITRFLMDFFIETTSWIKHMSNSEGDVVKYKKKEGSTSFQLNSIMFGQFYINIVARAHIYTHIFNH